MRPQEDVTRSVRQRLRATRWLRPALQTTPTPLTRGSCAFRSPHDFPAPHARFHRTNRFRNPQTTREAARAVWPNEDVVSSRLRTSALRCHDGPARSASVEPCPNVPCGAWPAGIQRDEPPGPRPPPFVRHPGASDVPGTGGHCRAQESPGPCPSASSSRSPVSAPCSPVTLSGLPPWTVPKSSDSGLRSTATPSSRPSTAPGPTWTVPGFIGACSGTDDCSLCGCVEGLCQWFLQGDECPAIWSDQTSSNRHHGDEDEIRQQPRYHPKRSGRSIPRPRVTHLRRVRPYTSMVIPPARIAAPLTNIAIPGR